jgi:hypothetical protein
MPVATAERPGCTVRADGARRAPTRAGLAVDPRPVEATRGAVPWTECTVVAVPDDVAPAAEAAAGCDAAARDASVDGELECEPVGSPPPSGVVTVLTGSDGVLIVGVMLGVLTGGVVTVAVVTDGTVTGRVTEGTVAEGTLTDGTLTDGTVTAVDGTLPSATAADAPAAATNAPHATSEPLRAQLLTPAPRTASQPRTSSTLTKRLITGPVPDAETRMVSLQHARRGFAGP